MKVLEIAFTFYPVTDLKRARQFYEATLGLREARFFGNENQGFVEYDIGTAESGCTFTLEPMETPVCHMAVISDPDGNSVMIHQRKAG
jgi:predicted enzyme related to lactoylglutathione lyase